MSRTRVILIAAACGIAATGAVTATYIAGPDDGADLDGIALGNLLWARRCKRRT